MLKKTCRMSAEANHNLNRRIRPLSKGLLGLLSTPNKKQLGSELTDHTVGLIIQTKESRNDVTVVYGDPIPMKQYQELFEQDKRKAANVLKMM